MQAVKRVAMDNGVDVDIALAVAAPAISPSSASCVTSWRRYQMPRRDPPLTLVNTAKMEDIAGIPFPRYSVDLKTKSMTIGSRQMSATRGDDNTSERRVAV